MMRSEPQSDNPLTGLVRRLDGIFGELNAMLLALAIGLAALDATCFYAIELADVVSHVTGPGAVAHTGQHHPATPSSARQGAHRSGG